MPQIRGTTRGDFGFEYDDCSRMSRNHVFATKFLMGLESERGRQNDRRSCFDFTACVTEENGKRKAGFASIISWKLNDPNSVKRQQKVINFLPKRLTMVKVSQCSH